MAMLTTLFGSVAAERAHAQGDFGGLRRRLNLSDEQQKKIQQLYRDSDRRKREIGEKLHKLYSELDRLYDRYEFDSARVRSVTDEITEVRRRSLTLYMDNEEGLRRIITREQFDRLRDITKVRKGERESKDKDRD
ncbi:MAG: periplasmic heavy metal sensor [Fibrella sp.]|nr:periplasmic heavy metal sensor [Armatimonadota bacterium]